MADRGPINPDLHSGRSDLVCQKTSESADLYLEDGEVRKEFSKNYSKESGKLSNDLGTIGRVHPGTRGL